MKSAAAHMFIVIPMAATLKARTRLREADARDDGPGNSQKPQPKLMDYYHSEARLCPPEALYGVPERWAPTPPNQHLGRPLGHLMHRVVLIPNCTSSPRRSTVILACLYPADT